MFLILEWNGILPDGWMGESLDEDGNPMFFDTKKQAEKWAEENCAFDYTIVKIQ